jgi:hypothetical protein
MYANFPDEGPSTLFPSGICDNVPRGPDGVCDNPNLRAESYGAAVQEVRAVVAKYPGLPNPPLLSIDEWNVNSGFDPRMSDNFGAAFVAAVLDSDQAAGLNRSAFYEASDDSSLDNFGVLTENFSPKPDYATFSFWHQLAGRQIPVSFSPDQSLSDPIGRVGAVAALASDGTVRVLVYNFAPTASDGTEPPADTHPLALNLDGLETGRYEASSSEAGTSPGASAPAAMSVSGPSATLSLTLPAQTVFLVTLTPSS